jgi:hypothetical protein
MNKKKMLSQKLKYRLSFIISSCGVLLLFCNPRVLLRTIFPGTGLAEIIGLFLVIVMFISVSLLFFLNKFRINKYGIFLLIFFGLSQVRLLLAGFSWEILVQDVPVYLMLVAITVYGFNRTFILHLMKAFTFAMVLHFISIYAGLEFIQRGIDLQTQYGISSSLVGRSPGFTQAPGILSLYASVGVAIGLIMFSCERRLLWILLLIASLFCGIGTLNRSFILAVAVFILVLLPIFLKLHHGIIKSVMVFGLIVVISVTILMVNSSYTERLSARFSSSKLETDIDTRLNGSSGLLPIVKAFISSPLIGPLKYNHELGKAVVYVNGEPVSPSNGFASIFISRGFIMGGFFIFWSFLSSLWLWRLSNGVEEPYIRLLATALLAGFFIGQIVCLFDALLESSVMMLLLAFGLTSRDLYKKRNISNFNIPIKFKKTKEQIT